MSSENRNCFISSFSICMHFISSSCLIVLNETSNTMLSLHLFPILVEIICFKRHSVLFKHSWRHLLHAKKAFIFGRIQNVHRDIWTMPTHLPNPTCHYHVSYQGNKGLLLAISSQNTNTGAIKCDNILIY